MDIQISFPIILHKQFIYLLSFSLTLSFVKVRTKSVGIENIENATYIFRSPFTFLVIFSISQFKMLSLSIVILIFIKI